MVSCKCTLKCHKLRNQPQRALAIGLSWCTVLWS